MHEARDTVLCEKAGFSTVHGRYSIETDGRQVPVLGLWVRLWGDDFVLLHWWGRCPKAGQLRCLGDEQQEWWGTSKGRMGMVPPSQIRGWKTELGFPEGNWDARGWMAGLTE